MAVVVNEKYSIIGEFDYDSLVAGEQEPIIPKGVILAAGQGVLARGTLLGIVTLGTPTITHGTNTGDATLSSATLAVNAQRGAYVITCIAGPTTGGANNAKFSVFAPDGSRLADATQHVAYTGGHLIFTISNATSVDSAVGDTYTVTVPDGSELAVVCDATVYDGRQNPLYILGLQQGQLMDPTQTTIDTGAPGASLNVPAMAYQTGIFNRNAIICAPGQAISQFEAQLRKLGIILRGTIPNPTVAADAIALSSTTLSLTHGGATATLSVAFTPSNTTNQNVTWSSSDPTKATVSAAGVVTPVAAGTATITATSVDGGLTANCTVTVS